MAMHRMFLTGFWRGWVTMGRCSLFWSGISNCLFTGD